MRAPRVLQPDEAEIWARVTRTIRPLKDRLPPHPPAKTPKKVLTPPKQAKSVRPAQVRPALPQPQKSAPLPINRHGTGLDSAWETKLTRGLVTPDYTIDLHGASLSAAHKRLEHGLTLARASGARVILLITGRARVTEAAGRTEQRGAIRASVMDWIMAGAHTSAIAAVRNAHRRHGGPGALYIILRKPK